MPARLAGTCGPFAAAGEKALAEALADIGGERSLASTKSVGRILQFREGRIVFGLRLLSRSGRSGREYRIEAIGDPGRCGFGGFGGFDSGHFETGSEAILGRFKTSGIKPAKPAKPADRRFRSHGGLVMSSAGAVPNPIHPRLLTGRDRLDEVCRLLALGLAQ